MTNMCEYCRGFLFAESTISDSTEFPHIFQFLDRLQSWKQHEANSATKQAASIADIPSSTIDNRGRAAPFLQMLSQNRLAQEFGAFRFGRA